VVVTPAASNGGVVSPSTLTFNGATNGAQTFTVTRSSDGTSSVSVTNNAGLANGAAVSLTTTTSGGSATFPTWRQGLTLGQWTLRTGTALSSVNPSPTREGNTGPAAKIVAWTSFVNLEANTLAWAEDRASATDAVIVPVVDYYSTSPVEPTAVHSYYGKVFVRDRREVLSIAGARYDPAGGSGTLRVAAYNVDTKTWAAPNTWESQPTALNSSGEIPAFSQDTSTDDVYAFGNYSAYRLSATARTWTLLRNDLSTGGGLSANLNCYNACSAYDSTRGRFLIAGGFYSARHVYTPATNACTVVTFGGSQAGVIGSTQAAALLYVPQLDKFIYKPNAAGGTIYQIHPETWAVEVYATTGGSGIVQTAWISGATGLYNKLLNVPRLAGLVLITADVSTWGSDNVWFLPYANQPSDFSTRIAGTSVVWWHDFDNAAEVHNFRWTGGYSGGNDPIGQGDGSEFVSHQTSGGADNGGYLRVHYPLGSDSGRGNSSWWRPFNPLTGATNGKGAADPGAGGTITAAAWSVSDGSSTLYTWTSTASNPGFYGHATHQTADPSKFQGNDFYLQLRVRRPQTPGAPPDSGSFSNITGKSAWLTTTVTSNPPQELVTYGQSVGNGDVVGVQSRHNVYVGQNFGNIIDQPNVTVTLSNWTVGWRYTGGWDTLLYHITPGTQNGTGANRTRVEVWAQRDPNLYPAEAGRYTKIWDVTYTQGFETGSNSAGAPSYIGWNALLLSAYHNGSAFVTTAFNNEYDQVIFSKSTIPAPTV
jgi:hypothetical protein